MPEWRLCYFAQFSGGPDYSRRSNARVACGLTLSVSTLACSGRSARQYPSFQGVGLSRR